MARRALPLLLLLALVAAGCGGRDGARRAERDRRPATSAPATTAGTGSGSGTAGGRPTTSAAPGTTLAASRCGAPSTQLSDTTAQLTSGGVVREFQVAVPEGLDPGRPTPVVFSFHGSGSNMREQVVYSQLPERGTARGYVVVTPDGTGTPRGWALGGGTDDAFVGDVIAWLGQGMCVDQDRVFTAGISNGSAYAALSACREPYRWAAIGLVAAEVPPTRCPAEVRPTVVAFHGTADPVVPYGGGTVNAEGAQGLPAPAAEPAVAAWAAHDGCSPAPTERHLAGDVVALDWSGCPGGTTVTLHRIEGGGHTWPGALDLASLGITRLGSTTASVSATDVMLDTFDRAPSRTW